MALNQKIELDPIEKLCADFTKDVLERAKAKTVTEMLAADSPTLRESKFQQYKAYDELMDAVSAEVSKRLMDRYNAHR